MKNKKKKKPSPTPEWNMMIEWIRDPQFKPYSYKEFEQAFWHLWTLNCYHVTLSFDQNMVLLLDWALVFHMGMEK